MQKLILSVVTILLLFNTKYLFSNNNEKTPYKNYLTKDLSFFVNDLKTPFIIGSSELKFFGMNIYDISLWSESNQFSYNKKFAIQIIYNKSFNKEDLAKRTVQEIKKQNNITEEQEKLYYEQILLVFSSVKKGDEKVALFIPKEGVVLFFNKKIVGKISNLTLAKYFIDIWVSDKSSYPDIAKKIRGL